MDLSEAITQQQFGDLVGISQQAVSDLVGRGVLIAGETAAEWLLAYCDHLREMAAGRGGEEGINLVRERALLARASRIKLEIQNAEKKGQLAPVAALEQALATAGAKASKILATIKPEIRLHFPQLPASGLAAVDVIVGKALNAVASMSLDEDDEDEDDSEDRFDPEAEAA